VPSLPTDLSTLEDGRLDELAAAHRATIKQVRRMLGRQRIERPRAAAVDAEEVVRPSQATGPPTTAAEEASAVDDGRLEELAASLGITVGDLRRMIEVAGSRHGPYGGRLDVAGPRPDRPYRGRLDVAGRRRDGQYGGRLDVNEIRRRYEAGESLAEIGAALGASDTTVRNAMVRVGIPTRPGPRPAGERRGPLHRLDVADIVRRYRAGDSIIGIARATGASESGVYRVIKRSRIERQSPC
jgi:hypothetical protein